MILLWGIHADEPTEAVMSTLERRGVPFFMVDQQRILDTAIDMNGGAVLAGCLRVGRREVQFHEITAAYIRPWDSQRMKAVEATPFNSIERTHAAMIEEALISWSEVTPARVINRPSSMASNNSKPFQASVLRRCGFLTPRTLVTTDVQAVRDFNAQHGAIIYKSLSGVRSIVTRFGSEHAPRLPDVANCPTQFQEFVPGIDIRVHVIGSATYACTIASSDTDYRYPKSQAPEIRPSTVPPDIESACVEVANALGLLVAGIDLRQTPDGRWYCFEANPSPGFTFYEKAAGLPITAAVADLLSQP